MFVTPFLVSYVNYPCELPLTLRVGRKLKGWARDYCKSALNIEFEQDWSVSLGATLRDRLKTKKYYSSYMDFFWEKPIVHFVEVRKYNKPKTFYENRWSHFCENENFKFFPHVNFPSF